MGPRDIDTLSDDDGNAVNASTAEQNKSATPKTPTRGTSSSSAAPKSSPPAPKKAKKKDTKDAGPGSPPGDDDQGQGAEEEPSDDDPPVLKKPAGKNTGPKAKAKGVLKKPSAGSAALKKPAAAKTAAKKKDSGKAYKEFYNRDGYVAFGLKIGGKQVGTVTWFGLDRLEVED